MSLIDTSLCHWWWFKIKMNNVCFFTGTDFLIPVSLDWTKSDWRGFPAPHRSQASSPMSAESCCLRPTFCWAKWKNQGKWHLPQIFLLPEKSFYNLKHCWPTCLPAESSDEQLYIRFRLVLHISIPNSGRLFHRYMCTQTESSSWVMNWKENNRQLFW